MYRYVTSSSWCMPGSYSSSLAKGYVSTTWIFNLHAQAHDFDTIDVIGSNNRKIFASNIAHVSIVLTWLSGMHFHGAYFSNYNVWLNDPDHAVPTAQQVSSIVGQDILSADTGGYSQGLYITSGLFQMWRSTGIVDISNLKTVSELLLVIASILILASYLHITYLVYPSPSSNRSSRAILVCHMGLLLGTSWIAWAGHIVHVSIPVNRLLDAGLDTTMIPTTSSLISANIMRSIFPTFRSSLYPEFSWSLPTDIGLISAGNTFNEYTGSIYLGQITGHHFYSGISMVIASMYLQLGSRVLNTDMIGEPQGTIYSHLALAVALGSTGSLSITYAHHSSAMAV